MTDVQAAMGRIQLGRLNEFVEKDLSKILPIINNHYNLKTPLVQS